MRTIISHYRSTKWFLLTQFNRMILISILPQILLRSSKFDMESHASIHFDELKHTHPIWQWKPYFFVCLTEISKHPFQFNISLHPFKRFTLTSTKLNTPMKLIRWNDSQLHSDSTQIPSDIEFHVFAKSHQQVKPTNFPIKLNS